MTDLLRRRARRAVVALAVAGTLAVAAGCGSAVNYSGADVNNGKTKFATLCTSCHTLQDAGKPASYIGPNLDDAFRASRQAGMNPDQFAGVVHRWIGEAQAPMPRDLVTGQDAVDVAAYIAKVAGTQPNSTVHQGQTAPEVPNPPRQAQAPE